MSRVHFDANLLSEPLSIMNLLWDYERVKVKERTKWCWFYGVFPPRVKRLMLTAENVKKRVADYVGMDENMLVVAHPPRPLPPAMMTILRVIQVWSFMTL